MDRSSLRALMTVIATATAVLSALAVPAHPAPETHRCGPARNELRRPAASFPNDPLFPKQWNLRQIHAVEAWSAGTTGRGAVIAIVDSGVDYAHPDLERKI